MYIDSVVERDTQALLQIEVDAGQSTRPLLYKIDTGAKGNVIPVNTYKQLYPHSVYSPDGAPLGLCRKKYAWYDLLLECKTQSRFQDTAFIREVKCAPEPACFLGNNRQINDIARFGADPTEFHPLYVDATFNLGQFNVTILSYKNLLLENC